MMSASAGSSGSGFGGLLDLVFAYPIGGGFRVDAEHFTLDEVWRGVEGRQTPRLTIDGKFLIDGVEGGGLGAVDEQFRHRGAVRGR
jgi:hypothetical protein